jgi:alpha-L-fucosidase 2
MKERDQLILTTPASWHRDLWREGLPIGNGLLGGLVFGQIAFETIVINHAGLWHRAVSMPLPDVSGSLSKTRRLIDEGKFEEANWISSNALREKGYQNKLGSPLPLCAVHLDMGERGAFSHYRRVLDMDTAQVTVSWEENGACFKRESFISREDELLAFRVSGGRSLGGCAFSLKLYDTFESDTADIRAEIGNSVEIKTDSIFQCYAGTVNGKDFGAVMMVAADGGVTDGKNGLTAGDVNSCAAYVKFFVHGERGRDWGRLRAELEALKPDYDKLHSAHADKHRQLYRSADLKLAEKDLDFSNEKLLLEAYEENAPNVMLEKLWRYGRYLIICGTREDGLPFPLYGNWPGRYSIPWTHNMANENLQMIYWHIEVGGLIDLLRPVIKYYTGMMDDFRSSALKVFGLRGIYVSAGTTPISALPNQIVPVIMNWIGAAGWIARHFYNYYRYTRDEDFFKKEIWPFLYETALFYADYLVERNGTCIIYPSVSPENTPQNLMPPDGQERPHPCPSVVNATMDIAIIKELFGIVIKEGERMGTEQAELEKWSRLRSKLPEYGVTEEGNIREWNYPGLEERYHHRHLSHIYPVFPGNEFVAGRDTERLAAFALAVDRRILGAQSGWSLAHMSCINSRLERGNSALTCLDILARACLLNSFFTLHNDWRNMGLSLGRGSFAPIQMDANMGIVNALQEMIFFSGEDYIRYLPALPDRFKKGEARDFRFPGGRTSFSWDADSKSFAAEITGERKISVQLALPWGGHFTLSRRNTASGVSGSFLLELNSGETVTLHK